MRKPDLVDFPVSNEVSVPVADEAAVWAEINDQAKSEPTMPKYSEGRTSIQVSNDQRSLLISLAGDIAVEYNRHLKVDVAVQAEMAPITSVQGHRAYGTVSVACGTESCGEEFPEPPPGIRALPESPSTMAVDVRQLIGSWECLTADTVDSIHGYDETDEHNNMYFHERPKVPLKDSNSS